MRPGTMAPVSPDPISLDLTGNGAEKRTRTSTVLPLLAPEASASTNSAISARRAQNVTGAAAVVNEPGFHAPGAGGSQNPLCPMSVA